MYFGGVVYLYKPVQKTTLSYWFIELYDPGVKMRHASEATVTLTFLSFPFLPFIYTFGFLVAVDTKSGSGQLTRQC